MAGDTPGPNKGEGGRPLRGLTTEKEWEDFEKLCHIHCTREEICAWYGISEHLLNDRCKAKYGRTFVAVWEEKRKGGKISLRRAQWQKAVYGSGNVAMLIWLGKNLLGQSDNPVAEESGDVIFQTRIGKGGEIVQELKKMADANELKTFDAKEILTKEIEKKEEKKKAKTTKSKAVKKKKTTTKKKTKASK